MGHSQYHMMLAHVTPRGRQTPSGARALWERTISPRHLRRRSYSPSYTITPRDSSPIAGRRVDVMCLYINVAYPNHTTQVCFKNTFVFQTIQTRKHTTVITGSSELIGRRPAYQSGRPSLY